MRDRRRQQIARFQTARGPVNHMERQSGTLGNVEQRMITVGEVQRPKQRHRVLRAALLPPDRRIETAPA